MDNILNELLPEYLQAQENFKIAKKHFDDLKKELNDKLIPEMEQSNTKTLVIETKYKKTSQQPIKANVTLVQRKSTSYNIELMETLLTEEVKADTIRKEYVITDWNQLVNNLKARGMKAQDVTPYIEVRKTANDKAIKNNVELGYIQKSTLERISNETVTSKYLKVTVK